MKKIIISMFLIMAAGILVSCGKRVREPAAPGGKEEKSTRSLDAGGKR